MYIYNVIVCKCYETFMKQTPILEQVVSSFIPLSVTDVVISLPGDHGHHGGIHGLRDNGAPVSPMTPQNPWDSKKVTLAVP